MVIIIPEYKVKVKVDSLHFNDERLALCREDGNPLPYETAPRIPPVGEDYEQCHRAGEPENTGFWEDTIPDTVTTMQYTDAKTGVTVMTAYVNTNTTVTYFNLKKQEDGTWTAEYKVVKVK